MKLLPITQVRPQTLKARLDRGEPIVIVDVHETWEYSLAHIPGTTQYAPVSSSLRSCIWSFLSSLQALPSFSAPGCCGFS